MTVFARSDWSMPGPLGLPMKSSKGFWLHHSVTKPSANPVVDARTIARIGMGRFGRLSYSWLVHPDGSILQGQDGHVGAHTRGQNSSSESICCIGNYDTTQPSQPMRDAVSMIVAMRRLPLLGGHRDAPGAATVCPGRNLQSAIPRLHDNAMLWEGRQNKPSWLTDADWDNLIEFARKGQGFPPA